MGDHPLARRCALYFGGYWYRLILTRGDPDGYRWELSVQNGARER